MMHLVAVGSYVQTHLHSIALALLASYVIGFLWHGPLFGTIWMKYNKIKPPKKGEMKFSMMLPGLSANFVLVFVQSAVLGRTFQIVALNGVSDALIIATILWLPFTALVIVNEYAWLGKPVGHMALTAFYNMASLWAIAAVLYATL